MLYFAIMGRSSHAWLQVKFPRSWLELVNQIVHACRCSIAWEKCIFLTVSWVDCPRGLRNFWAEQLTAAQICKSWAEKLVDGKNCANPARRVGWQDCSILEPSRLLEGIAQFLEGRLVALQKCANFTRKLLNLQLD